MTFKLFTASFFIFFCLTLAAQNQYELDTGWVCSPVAKTFQQGVEISAVSFPLAGWLPATVPGTVLTTLLNNNLVPDPFYGMNNNKIPDIYTTGRNYYTYWFVKNFKEKITFSGEQVWLKFRGINYSCDVFLNGHKLNEQPHKGMYLRLTYNITSYINKEGYNRLAVIVYPPDPVGNPNGGQGGDGEIARNVTHQYVAGWDWIPPIRDRNTGIWDKVTIEKTNTINLKNPHIITLVAGKRFPDATQQPVIIKASAEIENPASTTVQGILQYQLEGKIIKKLVTIAPNTTVEFSLPDYTLKTPKLWWPSGYGSQYLYPVQFQFISKKNEVLDAENIMVGVREIQTSWNTQTKSREVSINGQKIFIRGGNWIISDAMLRFSPERYDAEIRFHRDMNLNLIRIWGGALTERPEFYQACDKYGMLVFQDFWFSGDCNGKWLDPLKKEDQWTRRAYPDDHVLALESITDQIKMIRNYPSLAFYCGGNEVTPPDDILKVLKNSILPKLEGTRYLFDYSNSDSMSHNFLGGNGDGPYGIQKIETFWEQKTFPFNSEVGSVGTGDYESLERFLPKQNIVAPVYTEGAEKVDTVWNYHKYIGYNGFIDLYGKPKDIKDFCARAQLVNYDEYRGLIEGFSSHTWDWYTGVIIWKTQNPWTALRGQMYDYYLDPNACLYGLRKAGEKVHVMYNPVTGMVMIINNGFETLRNCMLEVKTYNMEGKESLITKVFVEAGPTGVQQYLPVKKEIDGLGKQDGVFLLLKLSNIKKQLISENLYWLPDSAGRYSGLQKMKPAKVSVEAKLAGNGKINITIANALNETVAFFNRISLIDMATAKRILPVFYSDNYVSVLPGQQKTITLEYTPGNKKIAVSVSGWNVPEQVINIQ